MKRRKPIFMIHKHHATHLHYDLRLEIEGTLKSWALREIPLRPDKSILAIQVADHSFWYRHYEGVIEQGHYGAGPVMIWDKGLYSSFFNDHTGKIISPKESLKRGFLMIWLEGRKLKGGYILVRTTKKQRWLLIKMHDAYAKDSSKKPATWKYSVKSGKTLEQIFDHEMKKKGFNKINMKKWIETAHAQKKEIV